MSDLRDLDRTAGRRAALGVASYLTVGTAARALYLVVVALITRVVSVEVFAQYALVRVLLPALHTAADLGTSQAAVRFAGDGPAVAGTTFALRAGNATLISGLGILIVNGAAAERLPAAWVAAAAFWLLSTTEALASTLRADERHGWVAASHFAGAVAELGFVLLLWQRGSAGLVLVLGSLAARFAGCFVVVSIPNLGRLGRPRLDVAKKLLAFGLSATFAQLVSTASALDRWLLERLSTLVEVAAYQLASAVASMVEMFEQAVWLVVEPFVYRSGGDLGESKALGAALSVYTGAGVSAGLALALLAPELLAVLAPKSYAPPLIAVPLLAFAAFNHGLFRIVGLGAGLAGRSRPWALAGAIELALVAALFIVATPRGGASAAAFVRYGASVVGVIACQRAALTLWPQRLPVLGAVALGAAGVGAGCLVLVTRQPLELRLGVAVLVLALAGARLLRLARQRRRLGP